MRSRPGPALVGLVLVAALGACGDDGGPTFTSTTAAPPAMTVPATTAPTTTAGRTTAQILVPAAAFIPASNDVQYYNNGSDVRAEGPLGFHAPIWFPVRAVRIEEITLVAYDPNPDAQLCVSLEIGRSLANDWARAGQVCTGTGPVLPQIRTLTDLDPRDVDTATEAAYLYAYFDGPDVFLGAVQVTYSY